MDCDEDDEDDGQHPFKPNFGLSDPKKQIIQFVLKLYFYTQGAWRKASRAHYNFNKLKVQEGQDYKKYYETEI